jgi:diacylglycerol kinase (ATP)
VRVVVLVNPGAGGADALADVDTLAPLLQSYRSVRIVQGRAAGELGRRAARAVREGADVVVAAGGDGTLNEVANGVAAVRGGLARVALGLLPLGTGNDLARTLGIPTDLPAAVAHLATSRVRRLDAASLDGRLFLNASGGGFTAETSTFVSSALKAWTGRFAYVVGGVQALREHVPVRTDVAIDGHRFARVRLHLFAVCNGRTLGGGYTLAPQAEPDDGWLDVLLVHGHSSLDLMTLLPRLSSGQHVDEAQVLYTRARRVSLRFARRTTVNVDGEVLVRAACHYRLLPGAVRFVG